MNPKKTKEKNKEKRHKEEDSTKNKSAKESQVQEESVADDVTELLTLLEKDKELQQLIEDFDQKSPAFSFRDILENDKRLIEEATKAKKERDEYLDLLQRFKADFENYKKRMQKQTESNSHFLITRVISKLFEPIEDLSRAINFADEKEEATIPLEGITLIYGKMMRILEDEGVTVIAPEKNEPFNPQFHEAVCLAQEGTFEPNVIVQVFEKGYKLKDKVIRAAKVMVSPDEPKQKHSEEADSAACEKEDENNN